jgi:hypothetical protein
MNRYTCILLLLFFSLFYSCRNSYEDKIVGKYRISQSFGDSLQGGSSFTLDLLGNKSFVVKFEDQKSQGKWKAADDGDRTWVRFSFDNGSISDAQVGGPNLDTIDIWNPRDFMLPQLKSLSLYRVFN